MVGWLTALLIALIAVSALSVREHATFTAASPSGEGNAGKIPPEYQSMLDAYTTNYRTYVKNNDAVSKAAADQVASHIEDTLDDMREQIDRNQVYIQTFLDDYQDINPDLSVLHKKAQSLKDKGHKIADELVVSSQDPVMAVDYGALTVRIVILAVILGAALAISSFA